MRLISLNIEKAELTEFFCALSFLIFYLTYKNLILCRATPKKFEKISVKISIEKVQKKG